MVCNGADGDAMRTAGLLIVVMLTAAGCFSSRDPTEAELAQVYRTGMTRAVVAELFRRALDDAEPMAVLTRPAGGWAAREDRTCGTHRLLPAVEAERGVVVQTCEVRWVPRGFMWLGIYWDYLWFDADDRLLGFRRRFVD